MDNNNGPNTTFPRDNGESINMIEVESRCLYFKRVGVIVCLILLFMDGGTPKGDYRYVHKEVVSSDQSTNSQSSFVTKLNSLVSSARNIKSQNLFARNVTGIYHGQWGLGGAKVPAETEMRKSSKAVTIQLRSVKLRSVADFDFVYGVARIYDAGISGSDLFYPLQGVFLAATGELHLLSSVEATEMLFLQLPRKLPDENVSPTRSVPEPVERVDSQAISEPTKIENRKVAANHLLDEAGDSTVRIDEDSRRSMLTEFTGLRDLLSDPFSFSSSEEPSEALLDYRNPVGGLGDRRLFDDMGGLSGLIFESRRHLVVGSDGVNVPLPLHVSGTAPPVQKSKSPSPSPAPLSRPQSLPVGSTGMILHLINLAQPLFVASNSSSSFTSAPSRWVLPDMDPDHMQAIGESALPVTFKNLQRSTSMERLYPALAFNSGRGGPDIAQKCRFSMKLQEPPMDNSPGKDEQWTLIDQLLGNITNSDSMRVAGTEDKTSEKKKDAEAIAEAASARSKAAYASTVSGTFESIDCGVYFNITATSFRMELAEVERKAIEYSILACGLCYFQFLLLFFQLAYNTTQAASSKTSILCMSLQSMLDAALCIGHLILCAALPQVFFAHFIWMAILKLLLFGVFEMRLVIVVYQARYAQEISTEGLRHRLFKFHLRFYAALFAAVVVTSYCRKMPIIAILIFYSYWVPQIAWNTVCGSRRTIHAIYYIGTTLSRLFIPLYLLGCPNNFFSVLLPGAIPYSPATCVGLVLWSMLQLSMLIAQDILGPRFFLPADMFPGYDYFRPVPAHVLIGARTLSPGNGSSSTDILHPPDVESGGLIECVICYNAIDTTNSPYMITPCDHLYHKACLEQWLTMKMECCICRSALPPLLE